MNLHHRLLRAAELRLRKKSGRYVSPNEYRHVGIPTLAPAEERAWNAALAYYERTYAASEEKKTLALVDIDNALTLIDGRRIHAAQAVPRATVAVLQGIAPVYEARFWKSDNQSNAAWLRSTEQLVGERGDVFRKRLPRIFGAQWLSEPYRVDVVYDATYPSEYSEYSDTFWQIVMSSGDPLTRGYEALELLFHEASHSIVRPDKGPIGSAIRRAAQWAHRPPLRDLAHTIIFYTTGRLAETVAAENGTSYTMVAARYGLFADDWAAYWPALANYWEPYMNGHGTLEGAVTACAMAIYGGL